MKERFRIGEELTLVSKGLVNGYGQTWTDERQIGDTSFFKVTKNGTQYVYGSYFRFEEDGSREDFSYEARINPGNYVILRGIHQDLRTQYRQYTKSLDRHKDERDRARREFEWELHDMLNAKMDKWDEENPRPTPIDLESLKDE